MAKEQTILYFFVWFMLLSSPHKVLYHSKFGSQATKREREKERDTLFVAVRDNNVDQALRVLKKKMQREGLFREMKNRRAFEKPSERRARETAESTRHVRKLMRKRMEREGY